MDYSNAIATVDKFCQRRMQHFREYTPNMHTNEGVTYMRQSEASQIDKYGRRFCLLHEVNDLLSALKVTVKYCYALNERGTGKNPNTQIFYTLA